MGGKRELNRYIVRTVDEIGERYGWKERVKTDIL